MRLAEWDIGTVVDGVVQLRQPEPVGADVEVPCGDFLGEGLAAKLCALGPQLVVLEATGGFEAVVAAALAGVQYIPQILTTYRLKRAG